MSAFVVSEQHINALVNWASRNNLIEIGTEDMVGQELWNSNVVGVNHRYIHSASKEPERKFRWSPMKAKALTPIEAIKAIQCLIHQSDEHPDWEKSKAYSLLESWKEAAIYKLPGYDAADWCID